MERDRKLEMKEAVERRLLDRDSPPFISIERVRLRCAIYSPPRRLLISNGSSNYFDGPRTRHSTIYGRKICRISRLRYRKFSPVTRNVGAANNPDASRIVPVSRSSLHVCIESVSLILPTEF